MPTQGLENDRALWVRTLQALNRIFVGGYHKPQLRQPCTIPRTGPAIVICNHFSSLDPFTIQSTSPRVIRWLMAKEFYDIPVAGAICARLGFISVARNGRDSASLKQALRTLHDGHVIGIFPEGKINDTTEILPFQPGVALLATRTCAPVVPARISAQHYHSMLYPVLDPQRAIVQYGRPFFPVGDLHEVSDRMRAALLALKDPRRPRATNGRWW